jgi:hypothetical protein
VRASGVVNSKLSFIRALIQVALELNSQFQRVILGTLHLKTSAKGIFHGRILR